MKQTLNYSDELSGLGANFWDTLKDLSTKVTNVAKEVKKGATIFKEIKTLTTKPKKPGVTVVSAGAAVVVEKPGVANDLTPPNGIPEGSYRPEPQIAGMTATDSVSTVVGVPKSYLLYGGLGAAAIGAFWFLTRPRTNPRRRR